MPELWSRAARQQLTAWVAFSLALLVFALGCATPVGVRRVSLSEVDRILGENAVTGDAPSALSRQILARLGLSTLYEDDPRTALEKLRSWRSWTPSPGSAARAGSLLGSPHSTSSAPPKPHLFPTTVSEETVRARLGSGSGPDRP